MGHIIIEGRIIYKNHHTLAFYKVPPYIWVGSPDKDNLLVPEFYDLNKDFLLYMKDPVDWEKFSNQVLVDSIWVLIRTFLVNNYPIPGKFFVSLYLIYLC